jgi:hypothetical protein
MSAKRNKRFPGDRAECRSRSYFRHAAVRCGLSVLVTGLAAANATIIITVRDSNGIVMGADSRVARSARDRSSGDPA